MNWEALIIHHTASSQNTKLETIRRWHKERGWQDVGYHYVMEIHNGRGVLKIGRPDTQPGAHTVGWNNKAIGLVVVGNYDTETIGERLYMDILAAVVHICLKYSIPADKIFGHRDKASTACPGKHFPLAKLREEVKRSLAPTDGVRVLVDGLRVDDLPPTRRHALQIAAVGFIPLIGLRFVDVALLFHFPSQCFPIDDPPARRQRVVQQIAQGAPVARGHGQGEHGKLKPARALF
jgi:hypothetical protein